MCGVVTAVYAGVIPEDELHQAENSDFLPELVDILGQGRLAVQHCLVLAAKLIVSVQISSMEALQHLLQPSVVLHTV